ncbi:MAG TPA: PEP-CTERM/exosortase system-associated acyltransferase [Pseudomonadales bacterium]|nr:PEP-CTERM/exosortase system-associated acyltransferase [Pseudomonadales bacterium]
MTSQHVSLLDDFRRFFKLSLATTDEQKRVIYRLRYRVYCEELRYEDPSAFPDRLETDEFDARSLHCAVIHKRSGIAAGCVRLVRSPAGQHETPLPMERYCAHALDPATVGFMKHNRDTICELSRLAVDSRFRRRLGEAGSELGELAALDVCDQEERTFSLVATAAIMAGIALTDLSGCSNVFAMMEVCLPRVLSRTGLYVERAGEEVDYHGRRAPFFITTEAAVAGMNAEQMQFYHEIRRGLAHGYAAEVAREAV